MSRCLHRYLENRVRYEHSSVLVVLGLTLKDTECSGARPNLHGISVINSAF